VHKVYPKQILLTPNFVIIFFHGFVYGKNIVTQWKETWTSTPKNGMEHVFWLEKWLLENMGDNVWEIMFTSFLCHMISIFMASIRM
jgi:hypothetical protein